MNSKKLKSIILGSLLFAICGITLVFGLLSHSVAALQAAGVSSDIIFLVETLPFTGLFLAFFRIILGINVPNMFVSIVIIITSLVLGLIITLEVLLISVILAYIGKFLINEFHLHFAVKSSLIISQVAIGLIIILPYLRESSLFNPTNSHLVIVYGLLIISIINDKFLSIKMSVNNLWHDFKNILKTIFFSTICFFMLGGEIGLFGLKIQWDWLKTAIINYPETIFIALLLTLAIGRYTGLRLSEIIRFRKLIFNK